MRCPFIYEYWEGVVSGGGIASRPVTEERQGEPTDPGAQVDAAGWVVAKSSGAKQEPE